MVTHIKSNLKFLVIFFMLFSSLSYSKAVEDDVFFTQEGESVEVSEDQLSWYYASACACYMSGYDFWGNPLWDCVKEVPCWNLYGSCFVPAHIATCNFIRYVYPY